MLLVDDASTLGTEEGSLGSLGTLIEQLILWKEEEDGEECKGLLFSMETRKEDMLQDFCVWFVKGVG